jgi:energy-converting hydrogenase A subunit M
MAISCEPSFFQRHPKKVVLLFLLMAFAGAFLAYRPAQRAFKTWRAESLLEEAQEFADAGNWEEARRTAVASLQNEGSLAALRLLSLSSIKTDDPRSLEFVYSLFAHPEAEAGDRAMALERALGSGDLLNASQMVRSLSEDDQKVPALHCQIVNWLLLSRQFQEAIQLADASPIEARDPALDLLLAKGLAGSGLEGAREITTARLGSLMKGDDRDLALQVLTFLTYLKDGWIYEPLAEATIQRFEDDPDLRVTDRLNLEFLRLGLKKVDPDKVVADTIAKYQENNRRELVVWLKRVGESKRIVALTGSEAAKSNPDLFSARISALERLGLWAQLEDELQEPSVFIAGPLLLSAQATAAFRTGDQIKFFRRWQDAIKAAKLDLNQNWFYRLAASAGQLQDTDRQMEALVLGIEHPMGKPPNASALSSLFQWLLDRGETERLLEVSYALLRHEPQNPLLINNHLYLKALHGQVNDRDVAKLRGLREAFPKQTEVRDSLALVLLQNGEPQAALAELKMISPETAGLSPSGQAVYAKALQELGREEEAAELGGKIAWESLTEAEQKLLALSHL